MLIVTEGVAAARFGFIRAKTSASSADANGASKGPKMAISPIQLGQDPQYKPFLYAALGEDRRGSSVTVLSMLARLGVDPWGEASDLAKLPEGAARQRLEALLTRFHDIPTPVPDRSRLVSGLLELLPRRAIVTSSPQGSTSARFALTRQGSPIHWLIAAALFLGWIAMLAQGQ